MAATATSYSALVTGGAQRLGQHIALHLAQQGWDIALHYHQSQAAAQSTRQKIQKMGRVCELFAADFADLSQSKDAAAYYKDWLTQVRRRFSSLQLLVNNAALYEQAPLRQTTAQMWDRHFAVNVRAPFFLTQAFAAQECIQNPPVAVTAYANYSIINILDNKIAYNQYHYAAYALTKKNLAEFTKLAAMELAPQIRVNGIAPGIILPLPSRENDYLQWRLNVVPLGKRGQVRNILHALDYLLQNDFVTGQILTVDGGENQNFIGRNFANYSPTHSD